MSSDLSIAQGLAEIVAGLTPSLVPTATIAEPGVTAGATVVPLTSVAGFTGGGRFDVWDGTAERSWSIDTVDPIANTVTIRTAGLTRLGITGLTADHAAGALVTTNLMAFEAVKIAHMLGADWPVVLVYATTDASRIASERKSGPTLKCNIEVRRSILRAEDDAIDPNDFVALQQERIREALATIQDTVQGNRHLVTSQGPLAQSLGDGTGAPEFTKNWGRLVISSDNEQYIGVLSVTIRGQLHTF